MEEEHTVTVKVSRANRLKGRKAEFQSFVKVEVDATVLGESEKKACDPSDNCFNYEYSCSFQCSRDPLAIAELARKLLIVTVSDFLPEERKASAKTTVLGQAVLDFLPLLHGQTTFSSSVAIHSGAAMETKSQEFTNKALSPSLDVVVNVSEALVPAEALSSCNLLKVTLETAFSVPESWTLPAGSSPDSSSYTAALEVPVTAEKNQMLVFCDGVLKAGGVKEAKGRQKKRPFLPQLLPANTFLPDAFVDVDSIENEDGELTGDGDRLFRKEVETKKNRVSWDVEMCSFLNGEATNRLREKITKCRLWPLEIMRSMVGAKMPVEENPQIPFHGVAFMDMGRLLFPGATRIRGAYCIEPFSDNLLSNKAKRSGSVLKEHIKAAAAAAARCPSVAGGGKKAAGNRGSARRNKMDDAHGVTEVISEMDQTLYLEARTYVMIEISLEKPLIPKTPPEELSRRVTALIPPKPQLPKGPTKAERAVQNYHRQVGNVVSHVCEQVGELYGAGRALSDLNREHMKAQVMGELNISGRYFAFKEQLKHSVVRVVRDKMQRTETITHPRERQEFVSKLYVFLEDEMHVTLNKIYSDEADDGAEDIHLSQPQLRCFAKEAQCVGDYELALQYYQELLVRNPNDPLNMFNLGSHYMLTGDYLKAKECFHDAVATDPAHQPSLIMCGVLAMMLEEYADAQTFLEQAATLESHGVEAWTLLGLLHQSQEEEILGEKAFLEATKLLKAKVNPTVMEAVKNCSKPTERGTEERATEERATEERATEERATKERATKERAKEERAKEERATEERAKEESATEDRGTEERAKEERGTEERAKEGRATEEGATEERGAEERTTEERTTKERAKEERATEERTTKERAKEERATEERTTKERAKEERATEERTTEEGATKERTTEEGATKERAKEERATKEIAKEERATKERGTEERAKEERATKERGTEERAKEERATEERAKEERATEERAEVVKREAPPLAKHQQESNKESPDSSYESKAEEDEIKTGPTVYKETVNFLLQNYALQMAERTLAQELLSSGGHTECYLLHLAHLHLLREDYNSALACLEEALDHNDENTKAWALKGHCQFLQGSHSSAQESYECSLSLQPPPQDLHLVLLRLGNIYQLKGQFEQAKEIHLQACEQSPSCLTWLGLGVACYRLGELSLAESALTEANHLNNKNAQVWIYIAFICLKSGRLKEAEKFSRYAQQFKLQNEELMREYTEMHDHARFSHIDHHFEGAAS